MASVESSQNEELIDSNDTNNNSNDDNGNDDEGSAEVQMRTKIKRVRKEPESSNQVDEEENKDDDDEQEEEDDEESEAEEGDETKEDINGQTEGDNEQADNDEESKTNLIVNYLPQQMSDPEFEELFKKYGEMKSCKIVRNRVSGYSYGFGFVDFATHEQAVKAIDELNGHELENKKIKVAFARPAGQDIKQANLYIKGVPNSWTQEDVKKVFEPYGSIIQVRVLGNDRGVAFVLFDLRKQAEEALQALNGKKVDGCSVPFEIKFAADKKVERNQNKNNSSNNNRARSRSQGQGQSQNRQDSRNRQSFNNNNNRQGNNRQGRQGSGQRGSFFERQGNRSGGQYQGNFNQNNNGVGPMRQNQNNRMNRYAPFVPVQQMAPAPVGVGPMGAASQIAPNPAYGYPAQQQQMIPYQMMTAQPQMAPMQTLNQPGQTINPATQMSMYGAPAQLPVGYAPVPQNTMTNMYSVASSNLANAANMQPPMSQSIATRSSSNNNNITRTGPGVGVGSGDTNEGCTLFVYNIGPHSNEDELKTLFSPYGQVLKCNVVRKNPGGETKGFGFVTLKNSGQANAAISGLDGSMRDGRTLQVSLKK